MDDTLLVRISKAEEHTRTSFDKMFEKVFRVRVDGAGNWAVCVLLVLSAAAILAMHRSYNDRLRMQADEIIGIKEEMQREIEAMKEQQKKEES